MFNRKRHPYVNNLISASTRLDGSIAFQGALRVDGIVVGDIVGDGEEPSALLLGKTAQVQGNVQADYVVIEGAIMGHIYARRELELSDSARVQGDLYFDTLEMEPGASVMGTFHPYIVTPRQDPASTDPVEPPPSAEASQQAQEPALEPPAAAD